MENTYYVIINPTTQKRLASYYFGAFCGGVKEVFRMRDDEWFMFRTYEEAVLKIERFNKDVDKWLNESIMIKQLPDWEAVGKADEFIKESKKTHKNLKNYIARLKIEEVI